MKALVYRGPGSLLLEERTRPHPGEGEALLKVDASSICGTDLRITAGSHRAYAGNSGRIPSAFATEQAAPRRTAPKVAGALRDP